MTQEQQQLIYDTVVIPQISETGFPITLIKPNNGVYDPDLGYTPGVQVDDEGFGLQVESEFKTVPDSIVQHIVKTVLCIEIAEPTPGEDKILIDDKEFKVLFAEDLKPGTVTFLYRVYLGV